MKRFIKYLDESFESDEEIVTSYLKSCITKLQHIQQSEYEFLEDSLGKEISSVIEKLNSIISKI